MGYAEPPVFERFTAFVPETTDPAWRSIRPRDFPRTEPYQLSFESAIRHACSPTDEQEHPSSIITRQCIEEAAGPFARAQTQDARGTHRRARGRVPGSDERPC